MARTQGHGNPRWNRDETILALNLYFECEGRIPTAQDERVIRLSESLRQLPCHAGAEKMESFRNAGGVVFKLMNLASVGTGRGMENTSKMDREIWDEFGDDPVKTKNAADLILASFAASIELGPIDLTDELDFHEGRVVTRLHIGRERNPGLRKSLLRKRRQAGRLACDACASSPVTGDAELDEAAFEAHHVVPLTASAGERKTRVSDMALLCANCHRIIHRMVAREGRWVTPEELKMLFQRSRS